MLVESFGTVAVATMVLTYALEDRSDKFILAFAAACAAASLYAVLIQSWPFAVVEAVWSGVALWRWRRVRRAEIREVVEP
jgi:multidrug transporter EmrE-like cation transporter